MWSSELYIPNKAIPSRRAAIRLRFHTYRMLHHYEFSGQKISFRIQHISGDGNCLFSTLSGIKYHTIDSALSIRTDIQRYARKNRQEYTGFQCDEYERSFDEWIEDIGLPVTDP